MSDLQIALLAIGIALIVAVFAYNKWQEARFRRIAQEGIKSGHADVLLRSSVQAEPPAGAARVEPTWTDETEVAGTQPPLQPASVAPAPGEPLSEAMDFIIQMSASAPVAGGSLIEAAGRALAPFGRRARLEARGAEGWTMPAPEQSYREMRAGLQLVDRRGAVHDADLHAFSTAVATAAATLGATVAGGGALDAALATASRLDRFCEQVDIQIAVHVVSSGGVFAGTRVRALAEAAGLSLEDDGRFHRRDERGQEVFALANDGDARFSAQAMRTLSTHALSLELDVPRAPGGPAAFARLRAFAQELAAGLGGVLVDDNRAPLDAAAFDAIAAQLAPVYESMRAQGIPAGSPLALRLFS